METRHAVVVGAGIGGVSAAVALGRRGWRVTLLERAPQLGEVGAGISLWPAAMRALDELGVASPLAGHTIAAVQAGLRRPDGSWVVTAPTGRVTGPVLVHRARLHDALRAGLGRTQVRTGVEVTGVEPGHRSSRVRTATGEVISADIVIAADGLRSAVRRALRPRRRDLRYAGYTAFRGIAPAGAGDGTGAESWGRGVRVGYVPMTGGGTYWFIGANAPAGADLGPNGAAARALTAGWHAPIPDLVASTPAESVLRNDVYDLALPLAPFARGTVALLGDAAHAMTPNLGQGACAAIVDTATLARALDTYADPAAALRAYDRRRRPPTTALVAGSRAVGDLAQSERVLVRAPREAAFAALAGLTRRRASPA